MRRSLAAVLLLFTLVSLSAADDRDTVLQSIESRRAAYADVAKRIWAFAEVGYQEQKSSALLQQQLRDAGFTIRAGVADIPTAFIATFGSGKPVVAIIGEFDALPGLSQEPVPRRSAVTSEGAGHGCGHNLLGTGAMASAIAVKEWLAAGHAGTLRYYGTPAEEGGAGKVYMVRAGLFSDVDAVVTWHPGDRNEASPSTNLANITGKFRFHGVAAHAAAAPHRGRSALDGVEAMDYMVNMMREHVPQETRIHYIITRGGAAPNVVPDFAEAYYYARQPDMRILDGVWDRIVDAAKGAALGTGTTMDFEITGAVWNVLPNEYLSSVMTKNLERIGGFGYTPEELTFAEDIRKTLTETPTVAIGSQEKVQPSRVGAVGTASTDLADVSWNVPTVSMTAATFVPGVPAHSWQATACAGSTIGVKGMMVAAKAMALTTMDLFIDPSHIQKARAEFDQKRGPGFVYKTRLADRKPALDYRK
ncbi:MAG TPA: amidohydrolase [Vicinamibacterales bacterium]|jgi:aminobenzoyl-glutamate utilization protein B|nr:amidohydrolase [Vicinamibacterales bacterium]